ncbi:DUF692 family multinuclear iron-containing protein [Novosphingobium sp. Gsoil 351]|uniref:MNIO family bufferin maturase n=1 Tax=Novosphingobium sp. Gsoil 351 TaxID=2675225 RepID=UPI0012B4970C|nr:DUF692 domain-containing protein [Novosphingobium sp. Gsoil 351]QGN55370.1 DUF692 family protein [Novosphingobium sp. Gsoil 351]
MTTTPTAGIGFKAEHFEASLGSTAAGLWFEVHAENYMVAGGPRLAMLAELAERFPISLHGVGLSLAGPDLPDPTHLAALVRLEQRFSPLLVSEHLAWSRLDGRCFPDLLPFPRTTAALRQIVRNVDATQTALGRTILIENPSHYLALTGHEWDEIGFLIELVRRTGCGLLLDVNNVAVSAHNLGFDAGAWLDRFPLAPVGEIHLAGHTPDPALDLLIDSHAAPVAEGVWTLFERFVARAGPRPTLIERDAEVPPFAELLRERHRAAAILLPQVANA